MSGWVYFVEHRESGIIYVGKTVKLPCQRWAVHKRTAIVNPISYFERALAAHGSNSFEWWIGEHFESDEEAKQAEIAWIAYLRAQNVKLYNRTDGGDGNVGWIPSEETRQRISDANRGKPKFAGRGPRKPLSEDHKMKLSKIGKDKQKSAEHRAKIGDSQRGIPCPQRGRPGVNNEMRRIARLNES